MKTYTVPGVPVRIQQDGWWLDRSSDPATEKGRKRPPRTGRSIALVALIALGDFLVWQVLPGLSLAVFVMSVVFAGLWFARFSRRAAIGVAAGGGLSVLPLVELVQPLSLAIAAIGVMMCVVAPANVSRNEILRGLSRVWWLAPLMSLCDAVACIRALGRLNFAGLELRPVLITWVLPMGATATFALLMILANPVIEHWAQALTNWQLAGFKGARLWFWGLLGLLVWPVLVSHRMQERLRARKSVKITVRRPGLVNADAVARSLVAFNVLFAFQTATDILFLYGDTELPNGISPAAYAHRGAYPLLATALLAGLFAVTARPFLRGRSLLRWLMLIWLAQTLALVVASIWRLDLYVEAFGLTRLRVAAYVWMGLVAAGLCIVAVQTWKDRPAAWMMMRSGALGAVVLYLCAFVSFDTIVAKHNLAHAAKPDMFMLCGLSEDVIPVLYQHFGPDWRSHCYTYRQPRLTKPQDWREWGFRNWRTRTSLPAMYSSEPVGP